MRAESGVWDPRLLLASFAVFNVAALSLDMVGLIVLSPLVAVASVLSLRRSTKLVPSRRRSGRFAVFVLFGFILAGHAVDLRLEGLWLEGVPVAAIEPQGLRAGLILCLRLALLYSAAAALTAMVRPVGIAAALRWLIAPLHRELSDRIFAMCMLVFRFLPRIWEIADETRTAAAVRGGRRRLRGRRLRGTAGAMVYRFLKEADRVAVAAVMRRYFDYTAEEGFSGTGRSAAVFAGCIAYSAGAWLLGIGAT